MILFLTLLVCFSPAEGFLQRKAIAATASSCRPSSERCVSRGAETRTTVSTGDNFNNHGDSSAGSNFQKLCELLSPDQSKFLKLDATDDGVRGVYTTQQIRQGDVILTVPLDYCLRDDDIPFWMGEEAFDDESSEIKDDSFSFSASSWAKRLAGSLIDLQLDAMDGSIADEASKLWLSLLPEPIQLRASLPVHWTEDVLNSAHSSALELAVDSAYFARAQAVGDLLEGLERCASAENLSAGTRRTMADNALDVVQTRTCRVISPHDGTPLRLLAPLFDMLNHRNSANAAFDVEKETYESSWDETEPTEHDALVVRALEDISANEEIYISYGSSTKPSWRCLSSYGFVPAFDPDSIDEESDDDEESIAHSAEIFLEGSRFEVGPASVSQELVDAMAECIDPTVRKPALFTPEVALRLAQRISESAFQMLLDDTGTGSLDANTVMVLDESETDSLDAKMEDEFEWSVARVISARQAAALRWNQHRILMSCSLGLRDWAARQSGSSM